MGAAEQELVTNPGFVILWRINCFGGMSEEWGGGLSCLEGKEAWILTSPCLIIVSYYKTS